METKEEIQTVKAIVEDLLEKDPKTRNSDKWLTYLVFEEIAKQNGKTIYIPFDLFSKFPAFETVKRVRAKIQNEEKRYLPTDPEVLEKRQGRQEEFKQFALDKAQLNLKPRNSIAMF